MKTLNIAFVSLLLLLLAGGVFAEERGVYRVPQEARQTLIEMKATVRHGSLGGEFIAELTIQEAASLRAHGYQIEQLYASTDEEERHFRQLPGFDDFHTYSQIRSDFYAYAAAHPDIAQIEVLGASVQGRELFAMKISDNVTQNEDEPELAFWGNIHGNEYTGGELPYMYALYLLDNYGIIPAVTARVNNNEIWCLPMINPDGRANGNRNNANNVDLNRDFGYQWDAWGGSSSPFSQIETKVVREFCLEHPISLATTFHCSGDVVFYPWGYSPDNAPDLDLIFRVGQRYADAADYAYENSWQDYETHGELLDDLYGSHGGLVYTVETSSSESQLPVTFSRNQAGMNLFCDLASEGLHGTVREAQTNDPLEAAVWISGSAIPSYTDPELGDVHRLVLPGTYSITVWANGYQPQTINGITVALGAPGEFQAALQPGGGEYAFAVTSVNQEDPNNAHNNATQPAWALRAPDGIPNSLGRSGFIVLDFGAGHEIVDGPGNDFTVTEAIGSRDPEPETYRVYAGNAYSQTALIGTATGTASFDLASAGVASTRYLKILDASNASPSLALAGMDLDAVTVINSAARSSAPLAVSGSREVVQIVEGRQVSRWETQLGDHAQVSATSTSSSGVPLALENEADAYLGQLLWQTGDTYGMCNDCAVSPDGSYMALGISLNNQRLELFQSSSSTPLWQYAAGEGATKVAVSENGEIVAFNYLHYLAVFNSASSTPLWTYDYGAIAWAFPVAISRDGTMIVAACMVGDVGHVIAFHPDSPRPIWDVTMTQPSGFGWYGLRICADGTRISATGKYTAWILDAATGVTIWETTTNNTETPVPLSADGTVIAIGSNNSGSVRVFRWDSVGQTYVEMWQWFFTGGFSRWCSSVAISPDGNTVAAGSLLFLTGNAYDGTAAVFDTWGNGQPLWVSSSLGDLVGQIAISDDGLTIAFGSWGDINNATPDLRIYNKYDSTPFFTVNSPGSINAVDMTPDGNWVFAGGKHVHNRIFGNGGDAYAISLHRTLTVALAPDSLPVQIPASGGSFDFTITAANTGASTETADIWCMVTLPDSSQYGPVIGPVTVTMPAGWSANRLRTQNVPSAAPAGNYHYYAYLGVYPDSVWDQDVFSFTKLGVSIQESGVGEWTNTGEDFIGGTRFVASQGDMTEHVPPSISPNPFNPSTAISYKLQASSHVNLQVYDTAGRLVTTLVDGWRAAGEHKATFEGSGLPSGIYLAKLTAGNNNAVQKLVLLK